MTDVAKRGDEFLLYVGNGAPSGEVFTRVAGVRPTSMKINGKTVDVSNKDTGGFQALLTGGGIKSVAIDLGGVYYAAGTQLSLRALALTGEIRNMQLRDGHTIMQCAMQVTDYEQQGGFEGEQNWSASLQSAAAPTFDFASDT